MHKPTEKPIYRSTLRIMLGKEYFRLRRWFFWIFGGIKFAHIGQENLPHQCFSHHTPLLRKLKKVDMYLQDNKTVNLKIAVKKLNKTIIKPGETFSYWKLVGKPTRRKGYLKGMVLKNGTVISGTGGGLCQMSNLIYWMAIHTPLTIMERHRHGYDVFPDSDRTQPFGSGATCVYNYRDLMIKNNTNHTFQLVLEITEHELKGALMSDICPVYRYEIYEKEHIVQSEFWGGYTRHNSIYRKKYDDENLLIDDEFVTENHAIMMYNPLLSSMENKH